MSHNWTIYMYSFPNGKKYVGATKRPLHLRQGSRESNWGRYRNCRLLWEAIQKYGIDSIETEVLAQGAMEDGEAAELERHYIALYKTNANRWNDPSYGYNQTDGGESTRERKYSEKTRNSMRERGETLAGSRLGKHPSKETRHRQSIAKIGVRRSPMLEETKRKIGYSNSLETMSAEERKRRSDSKKQPVFAMNPSTGEKLLFDSGEEAADYFGVRPSAISRWIDGSRNPRNGFKFWKEMSRAGVVA